MMLRGAMSSHLFLSVCVWTSWIMFAAADDDDDL